MSPFRVGGPASQEHLARNRLSGLCQSGPVVATPCHTQTYTQDRGPLTGASVCAHMLLCCVQRANHDIWDPPFRSTYT